MALRSLADVPNRIVRLFLQEAGRQYDENRGLPRFGSMTPALIISNLEPPRECIGHKQ